MKATIDGYARTQEGFEKRLARARKTMIYSAHKRNSQMEESVASQIVSAEKRLMRQNSRASELGELTPFLLKKRSSKLSIEASEERQRTQAASESTVTSAQKARRKKKKKVPTNTLFAVVIFDEFLKELAALSQEHSVLNPLLYLPRPVS